MEEAFVQMLLAGALGTVASRRVWWLQRPQASALPAVTLQTVAAIEDYTFAGRDGLSHPLVQVDCWGATYADALALERALYTDCDVPADARFQGVFVRGRRDLTEPAANGQPAIFRISVDVEAWFAA